ncbi:MULTISPECIES: AglZ/HisF2 family acetamidino modification protein [Pseudomonas]|jgi:cyclase|uniref:imidazole glycerol-phosphate synthase n=1 Tax=Pseudomonas rhodesiae TaxID=76760 RepID=A0AAE8L059_9PSED|nr:MULTISPECIES: AglZ/HisF2 family acetamidino modification protein [Pseudomonas]MDN6866111.1 AglZ/HisF2 family acetamidino modification protein [Pseudomonas rhodesiae]TWR52611.1 imidazole glycerol phosphate synthase subunit HisF [Pseudomonas rhodesiae]SDV10641.1 imidazole glycerol phosphate synthase subunit hisF [Pseudomonas rhodesiae]
MHRPRIIPCLLISGNGLVKTKKFKDSRYIGDPVNAVRIFSDKEADEIVVLDIDASKNQVEPNYQLIEEIAGEAFMPLAYGGGIRTISQVRQLIRLGIEKVVINTASVESKGLIRKAADIFGSQAIVGAVDIKRNIFGTYKVYVRSSTVEVKCGLDEHIDHLVSEGVGEIFINNIDRDGTMSGYDLSPILRTTSRVNVPVVACGGAGSIEDLASVIQEGHVSGAAAGSMFVFHGKHRAVLINYPKSIQL